MSDLASQNVLARTSPHLPLSWYFDPKVAEVEKKLLFDRGPGYVGHEQMVPNPAEYRVLDWRSNGAWSLVNNGGRLATVLKPFPHPPARILRGFRTPPPRTPTSPPPPLGYKPASKHPGG